MKNHIALKISSRQEKTSIEYLENDFQIDQDFKNDSYFNDNGKYIFYLDGVILNLKDCYKISRTSNIEELLQYILEQKSDQAFRLLNGSFKFLIIDRSTGNGIIATNRIGDHIFFYHQTAKGDLYISSSLKKLADHCRKDNIGLNLDIQSSYELLSYSYLLDANTLMRECKRLLPSQFITISERNISISSYYKFPNEENEGIEYQEAINQLDQLFKGAIKLEFEKDKQYTDLHFTTMSGGLDSRMTGLVAHEMGYINQRFFTFSQSGYLDHTIARKISEDYDARFSFVSLDRGEFINLDNLNHTIEVLEGQCSFLGGIHAASSFKKVIDRNEYLGGIIHSGQLGDVVVGNYSKSQSGLPPKVGDGADSKMLLSRLDKDHIDGYESKEHFMFYNRGFNGVLSCNRYYQERGEILSPFLENDFFDFALRLPMKFRAFHKIYLDWIVKKHRVFAKYKWENTKSYITGPKFVFRNKLFTPSSFSRFLKNEISRRLPISKGLGNPSFHMNPFDFWLEQNKSIVQFVEDYYKSNIGLVNDTNLKNDCELLMKNGSLGEKGQVLTLLAFIKNYELS